MNTEAMVKSMDFILSAAGNDGKCRSRKRENWIYAQVDLPGSVWRMNLGGREASTQGLREQWSLAAGLYTSCVAMGKLPNLSATQLLTSRAKKSTSPGGQHSMISCM